MTPVAGRHKRSAAFHVGAIVNGDAQLLPPHVGAPFMTPVAGTAQTVRHISSSTGDIGDEEETLLVSDASTNGV